MVEITKEEAEVLSALIDAGFDNKLWDSAFDKWVKKIQSKLESSNQLPINPQHQIPGLSMMG